MKGVVYNSLLAQDCHANFVKSIFQNRNYATTCLGLLEYFPQPPYKSNG